MDTLNDLAGLLRSARDERGVSQSGLARRTGIPQSAISRIEAGLETPSIERLARLLAGLGLRPEVRCVPLASHRGDPTHREAMRRMSPGQRIEQAAAWSGLAAELRGKASGAR